METATPRRLRQRPYDPDVAEDILARLSAGESLNAICKADEMPPIQAIWEWLSTQPEFAVKYARARDLQADAHADEITAICDERPPEVVGEGGASRVDSGWVQWQRNRIDARKWVASKLKPKKYGDASTLALTSPDGGPVEIAVVQRTLVDPQAPK